MIRLLADSLLVIAAILLAFLATPDVIAVGRFSVLTADTVRRRALGR